MWLLVGASFKRTKDGRQSVDRWPELMRSRRWLLPLTLLGLASGVVMNLRRSPGYHLAGIRLADARTGGPISLRQAATRVAVGTAWSQLVTLLTRGRVQRAGQQMRDIQPEIRALRDKHVGDPAALTEAIMALYEEHNIRPFASCAPVLVGAAAGLSIEAPALWSPLNQGLADRLAGTVVVRDR
jgi:uncharacterized RDD family membrane protein YckC